MNKKLKEVRNAVIVAGGVYLGLVGINYLVNTNTNIDVNNNHSFTSISRAEGLFHYTRFYRSESREFIFDSVIKGNMLTDTDEIKIHDNSSLYGRPDGLTDRLEINRSSGIPGINHVSVELKLTRARDYAEHKQEFDEADRILAETKTRFHMD